MYVPTLPIVTYEINRALKGHPAHVSHQVELGVKRRDNVEGVFPPRRIRRRSGRDDHDLVEDEDAVGAARQLEGRLRHHLQVAVVHRQDRRLGEDAGQDVQVARGSLHAESAREEKESCYKFEKDSGAGEDAELWMEGGGKKLMGRTFLQVVYQAAFIHTGKFTITK